MDASKVCVGDWIECGRIDAVVVSGPHMQPDGRVRVLAVHIDQKNRAVAEDFVFEDGRWRLLSVNQGAIYADNVSHWRADIARARSGR